jgi:hypothetical protein
VQGDVVELGKTARAAVAQFLASTCPEKFNVVAAG